LAETRGRESIGEREGDDTGNIVDSSSAKKTARRDRPRDEGYPRQ